MTSALRSISQINPIPSNTFWLPPKKYFIGFMSLDGPLKEEQAFFRGKKVANLEIRCRDELFESLIKIFSKIQMTAIL